MKKALLGLALFAAAISSQAQSVATEEKKVPVLGDLPIVGQLFVSKTPLQTKTVPFLSDLPIIGSLFQATTPKNKVPFLSDLPIIGKLFVTTPSGNKKSEFKDKENGGN